MHTREQEAASKFPAICLAGGPAYERRFDTMNALPPPVDLIAVDDFRYTLSLRSSRLLPSSPNFFICKTLQMLHQSPSCAGDEQMLALNIPAILVIVGSIQCPNLDFGWILRYISKL